MSSLQRAIKEKYENLEWKEPRPIDGCTGDQDFTFHNSQKFLKKYLKDNKKKGMLVYHTVGTGKCHERDTPILMFDGSIKKVQDILTGDKIMGDDSTPRKVLSLGTGRDIMYKIKPTKGDPFTVNSDHILCLDISKQGVKYIKNINKYNAVYIDSLTLKYKSKYFDTKQEGVNYLSKLNIESIIDIPLNKYLSLPKYIKRELRLYRSGIDFESKKVPFDPYIIGLWLGDGSKRGPVISNQDSEIIKYLNETISQQDMTFNFQSGYDYRISGVDKKRGNKFLKTLQDQNLINNKHIPDVYKINSREIRLQVLAGLLDSDGHLDSNTYEITQTREKLIDDIIYLSRSLGFAAYKNNKKSTWTYKGVKKYGTAFRISISGNINEIPCKIKRTIASERNQKKNVLVTNFKIEQLSEDDYYGFTLDSNHRYVMGDFTVTHNTCSSILTASAIHELEGYNIIWVTNGSLRSDMWKNIFDTVCHVGVKESLAQGADLPTTRNAQKRFLRKITKAWTNPLTYRQFSGMMEGYFRGKYNANIIPLIKSRGTKDVLKKTLIIVDEAHKMYGKSLSTNEAPNMYAIERAINNSYEVSGDESVKVLLLTATPIEESSMDGLRLMNLLLPIGKKFDVSSPVRFAQKYFNDQGTDFTASGKKQFMKRVEGLISHLNRSGDVSQFAKQIFNVVSIVKEMPENTERPFPKLAKCNISNVKKYIESELAKNSRLEPLVKARVFKLENPEFTNEQAMLLATSCQKEFEIAQEKNRKDTDTAITRDCNVLTVPREKKKCVKELETSFKAKTKQNKAELKSCNKEYKAAIKIVSNDIAGQCKIATREYNTGIKSAMRSLKTLERCGTNANCIDKKSIILANSYAYRIDSRNNTFLPEVLKRDLPSVAPKVQKLLDHIKELDTVDQATYGKKFKHLIFTRQHIKIILGAMMSHGYNIQLNKNNGIDPVNTAKENVFALVSGSINGGIINKKIIQKQLKEFNKRPDNIYGDLTRFLVIDSKFTEGIDVFDIKYIHILQRPKSKALLSQIIGRGTRLCGQKGLPFTDGVGWPLHIFQYEYSQLNSQNMNELINYDVKIVGLSDIDKKLDAILTAMQESAVDRGLTGKLHSDQMETVDLSGTVLSSSNQPNHIVPPQNTYEEVLAQRAADLQRRRAILAENRQVHFQAQRAHGAHNQVQVSHAQRDHEELVSRITELISIEEWVLGSMSVIKQLERFYNLTIDILKPSFKPSRKNIKKKDWHKVCNTPIDIMTQMDWVDNDVEDPDQDIIFIKWPNGRTECYDGNSIRGMMKQETSLAVDWIINPRVRLESISQDSQNQGMGYYPNPTGDLHMKIWPLNDYLTLNSLVNMFKSKHRYFNARLVDRRRLGNLLGSRGVSRLHAQLPEEKVHSLVPDVLAESSNPVRRGTQ